MLDVHIKLQQILDNFDWSAYKLSKESGLSESTLSHILSQKNNPSLSTIEVICNGLGITLSQFFAEGDMVELTEEQRELFEKWVLLTPRQKAAVNYIIDAFYEKR